MVTRRREANALWALRRVAARAVDGVSLAVASGSNILRSFCVWKLASDVGCCEQGMSEEGKILEDVQGKADVRWGAGSVVETSDCRQNDAVRMG